MNSVQKLKKIHFTSIGSSGMSDLAIALKQLGYTITGSDSGLSEELKSKLADHAIVATSVWSDANVQGDTNAVVIGSQIGSDNPEIKKAASLNIPIHSFPDFIYQLSENKQRIVVIGSTGKAAIVQMIIHVLNFHKRKSDYVTTGGQGKRTQIKISDAPIIVIEGQDVTTSVSDPVPAFLRYNHHIGLISGIEWQKSDTYPSKELYTKQFQLFAEATPKGGIMIYFELDPVAAVLSNINKADVLLVPYKAHSSDYDGGHEVLLSSEKKKIPLKISGKHNLQSISAAKEVLKKIGITSEMFYQAISTFEIA